MPTLNFPSNPQVGDVYNSGNRSWQYDGASWTTITNTGVKGLSNVIEVSNTAVTFSSNIEPQANGTLNLGSLGKSFGSMFTQTADISIASITGKAVISGQVFGPVRHVVEVTGAQEAVTTGSDINGFRVPAKMKLTKVVPLLRTAQSSGTAIGIQIKKNGANVLSTPITINNGSVQASAPSAVIDPAQEEFLEADDISIDVFQAGTGAAGLTIYLNGTELEP